MDWLGTGFDRDLLGEGSLGFECPGMLLSSQSVHTELYVKMVYFCYVCEVRRKYTQEIMYAIECIYSVLVLGRSMQR